LNNVLIVEDHDDARARMRGIIEEAFEGAEVCGTPTIAGARDVIASQNIDLVVLDLGLPDGNGADFITELKQQNPNLYIVVSTIHDESDRLLQALQNGAKGYLLKEQERGVLIAEFKGISRGKPPLAPTVTRRLMEFVSGLTEQDAPQSQTPGDFDSVEINQLTSRESEILTLLAKGFDRPEIAGFLNISKHTVASHISKIYGKMGIGSRSEAALLAKQLGLV